MSSEVVTPWDERPEAVDPSRPDAARTDHRVDVDMDTRSYACAPLPAGRSAPLWLSARPEGPIWLVRVEGTSGNSLDPHEPASWDVDVFADRDEAEACAEAVDLAYDVWTMAKSSHPTIPQHLPAARRAAFEEMLETMRGPGGWKERERLKALPATYVVGGREVRFAPPWQGHFDRLTFVEMVRLDPETDSGSRRWRLR